MLRLALLVLLLIPFLASCTRKTHYPERPVLLICPWSPGGGTDRVSRQFAFLLEQDLGVPVNVINATGGAGLTGHTRGALAQPDGYTLTMITVELNMLHWRGFTRISYHDFRPLVLLNRDAAALFVLADSPWQTLSQLADHFRSKPGALKASGTAYGGIWHLALAGWLKNIGLPHDAAIWISMNGAEPSLQQLIARGVEVVCCSMPEAKAQMDAGQIRCLGAMADERVEGFPDIPTFKEQGFDWAMGGWRGLALPAETPGPIALKLGAALDRVVHSAAFRQFMRQSGFNWTFEGPEAFLISLERAEKQFGSLLTSEAFNKMGQRRIGPMIFPLTLIVIGGAIFLLLLMMGELRAMPEAAAGSTRGLMRSLEALLWIAAYIAIAEWAGFVITATTLLAALMWRLGVRWQLAAVISLLLVPLLYQIFAVMLRVPLPRGWLGW